MINSYRSIMKFNISVFIDLIIDVTVECAFPKRISSLTLRKFDVFFLIKKMIKNQTLPEVIDHLSVNDYHFQVMNLIEYHK
jgi:hypothetical protein